ncbi:MAG: hypothetical protein ACLPN6_00080 [Streptosporangiaceae bacterium]
MRRSAGAQGPATWASGRGWAIWKTVKVLAGALEDDPQDAAFTTGVIERILADHLAET